MRNIEKVLRISAQGNQSGDGSLSTKRGYVSGEGSRARDWLATSSGNGRTSPGAVVVRRG